MLSHDYTLCSSYYMNYNYNAGIERFSLIILAVDGHSNHIFLSESFAMVQRAVAEALLKCTAMDPVDDRISLRIFRRLLRREHRQIQTVSEVP